METRIALVGIIVENKESAQRINGILHEYGEHIIGRMGIPYPKRNISVISVVMDAPNDVISALSGNWAWFPREHQDRLFKSIGNNGKEG